MNCGCIYSAGIIDNSKLIEPTISYCCRVCYETINSDTYYQIIEDLTSEIEQYEIEDLLQIGWSTSQYVKEYVRTHIGKDKLEEMWNNAKEIYEKY